MLVEARATPGRGLARVPWSAAAAIARHGKLLNYRAHCSFDKAVNTPMALDAIGAGAVRRSGDRARR